MFYEQYPTRNCQRYKITFKVWTSGDWIEQRPHAWTPVTELYKSETVTLRLTKIHRTSKLSPHDRTQTNRSQSMPVENYTVKSFNAKLNKSSMFSSTLTHSKCRLLQLHFQCCKIEVLQVRCFVNIPRNESTEHSACSTTFNSPLFIILPAPHMNHIKQPHF